MAGTSSTYDAVIVGSGPNGLAAGIRLAREGLRVIIFEAKDSIGGGTRTLELTDPGFRHDICSSVHPTGISSPFLKTLPLEEYGLEWIHPDYPYAHALPENESVVIYRSLEETLAGLGKDSAAYRRLFKPLSEKWNSISEDIYGTLRTPRHPLKMLRFGAYAMFSAKKLSELSFKTERAKAAFAGAAAHSILPLDQAFTSSFGLVLGASAHAVGWPFAKGGSSAITSAMAEYFQSLGGEIVTGHPVGGTSDIPDSSTVFLDITPRQISKIFGSELPARYKKKLDHYTYGPGTFKLDYALTEPVPWKDERLHNAGTIHLGGYLNELLTSERDAWEGRHNNKPYIILTQASNFDSSRAPEGKHTLWAYCHVPKGSEQDMSVIMENLIESHAPGFKDTIIKRNTMNSADYQDYNANYIGGDINGGAQFFSQLLGRPVLKWNPYKIPLKGYYICSSSTPPGGGVHGMCGYHAAESALKNEF